MRKGLLILILVIVMRAVTANAVTANANARAHFDEAMRLLAAQDTAGALKELERAIALDDNYLAAHAEWQDHTIELNKGSRTALIEEYRRRLAARPDSPVFHYLLGRLVNNVEAEPLFRRALELDTNYYWGHIGLARVYAADMRRSAAELALAAELCPDDDYARARLIIGLLRVDLYDEAQAQYDKAKASGLNGHLLSKSEERLRQVPGRRLYNLICFFAYLVAAFISSAFLYWTVKEQLKKPALTREDRFSIIYCCFTCFWFCLLLFRTIDGISLMRRSVDLLSLLMAFCNAFWPAVVYHLYYIDKPDKRELGRLYRYLLGYFYAAGLVMAGIFLTSYLFYQYGHIHLFSRLYGLGMFGFLGHIILVGVLVAFSKVSIRSRADIEDVEARSYRNWNILLWSMWLFVLWPVIIAAIFGLISGSDYGMYVDLLATLMPLAFIMAGTYYQARYLFMDLFIKRCAVVLASVIVSVGYYVLLVDRFGQNGSLRNIKYAPVIIFLPLIIAIPYLARGVEKLIDHYLFQRRTDTAALLSGFSHAIRLVSGESELTRITERYLTELFSTENVIVWLAREGLPASPLAVIGAELSTAGGALQIGQLRNTEAVTYCKSRDIELIVPLVIASELGGFIALGKRHYREPYFSEDRRLLASLADQMELALEHIELERTRRTQDLKEQELKVLAGKAELRALRAQINPHFLFNTLNTIASLIRKDPVKAEETVETLADFFRYTLAKSGSDFITLAEDLEFIKAYLEIEKVRFGDKLRVEMEIDPAAKQVKIPSMLLQPLVENSLKHGIAPKIAGGKITIRASCADGLLKLAVADDGVGFDTAASQRLYKDGVGVSNVRNRLLALYGNSDIFQIYSAPNAGTEIQIVIPLRIAEAQPCESGR